MCAMISKHIQVYAHKLHNYDKRGDLGKNNSVKYHKPHEDNV